ncbi:YfjI family protein [Symmachiella dynata]|uniref:YfjI family protein n=1 Tax=Symmachiella dynata TaxID=2527995 RepID=UPI0018D48D1B|nr:YfjI family protein [Symmachiella dynata]
MTLADLMPASLLATNGKTNGNRQAKIAQTYDYDDENGQLVFQVVRMDPKGFRQRKPKPGGGWDWSVKGVRVVPYRLPEVLADPQRTVAIVEGEKDVENLAGIGVIATCNAGGAGKWTEDHAAFLKDRAINIFADNDEPGRKHAEQVAKTLFGVAKFVRIVAIPGLPEKGDVSDWLAAGGTGDELDKIVKATPKWAPPAAWPKLAAFGKSSQPEFPTHALPGPLRNWVEAESHATQTPPDLAALLALAVCSSTIARRVEVEPRPGWPEPVNLFVAVLLEPGNRKSAVFTDATKPLRELEIENIESARSTVARAQSDRRQDESRLKRLEKTAAAKEDDAKRQEAGDLAVELVEKLEPVLPRLIVDDATAEKLAMIMEQQGGRIASMSAEGGVFDLMAGMYSKSGMPQFGVYLMGHSGDDLITDRVSRKSVRVERPALTCAYAMQPQVIDGLAENAAFRGRGLLARFLYAAPRSWIGHREIAPAPMPDATRDTYWQVVRALAAITDNVVLKLSNKAAATFRDWETEIEAMLRDGGQMELIKDWGAKLAGATLRIAAVFHCTDHGAAGKISAATIESAIEIARYLIPHAEAVLNMMQANESAAEADARYVLRWIERHDRREFTKREVQQHGKRRFRKSDDIDSALAELESRGYIRKKASPPKTPGRPPSPAYEINPAIIQNQKGKERSQYSQNSTEEPRQVNCGNIESASGEAEKLERVQVTI